MVLLENELLIRLDSYLNVRTLLKQASWVRKKVMKEREGFDR